MIYKNNEQVLGSEKFDLSKIEGINSYLFSLLKRDEKLMNAFVVWGFFVGFLGVLASFFYLEHSRIFLLFFLPILCFHAFLFLIYLFVRKTPKKDVFFNFAKPFSAFLYLVHWLFLFLFDPFLFFMFLGAISTCWTILFGLLVNSRKLLVFIFLFFFLSLLLVVNFKIGWSYLYFQAPQSFENGIPILFFFIVSLPTWLICTFFVYSEVRFYERFLSGLPAAVDSIKLASEENQREESNKLKLSLSLNLARDLQSSILPKFEEYESFCLKSSVDVAGKMDPATEVGGDYYDVLCKDNFLYIGIGDVTDHGLESGTVMLICQSCFRTALENKEPDIKNALILSNRVIYHLCQERMKSDRTMSLSFARYDANGTLFLTGQHEKAIICRQGNSIEWVETDDLGFIVGITDDIEPMVSEIPVQLEKGDSILFYTDGANEAENQYKEQLGEDAVANLFLKYNHLASKDMLESIYSDIYLFIDKAPVYDDITMVVLKRL